MSEMSRIEALERYEILDTLPEAPFDGITRLAAQLCGTPIALISLVDRERQWFKAKVGLSAAQTDRCVAFCSHAIEQAGLFVVEDALEDPRFRANPLVTGEPRVRFYAGAPLVTPEGHRIGTLCVIDHAPRGLSSDQREALEALARQVMSLLEYRIRAHKHSEMALDLMIAQSQLRVSEKAATEASRLKSQFLANVSHEVRTPINGVLNMLGFLLESRLTPEQKGYCETALRSTEELMRLMANLVDVSKIETGQLDFEEMDFDLQELVSDVEKLVRTQIGAKGLKFNARFMGERGEALRGDCGRVRQVLLNLVGNAIKFTPQGEVTVLVSSGDGGEGTRLVRFEVRDTGIGISPESMEQLFKPFMQADASLSRRFGGAGLGLAISKYLAERMGGEVGLESEQGKGSVFWFTVRMPRGKSGAQRRPLPAAPKQVRALGQPQRILIVEDNPVNQLITLKILQSQGFDAEVVGNGKEALQALEGSDYDLVLMDCQMPEMDGYEATRRIREAHAESYSLIPIIALTANAMAGDGEKCLACGMSDYLSKPLSPSMLVRVVRKWLAPADEGRKAA
jgi:signal transduction histidine kinase/ActR/RegA family two-component response regulator